MTQSKPMCSSAAENSANISVADTFSMWLPPNILPLSSCFLL